VRSFISAFGKVLQAHLKTVEVSGQEDKIEEFLHTCSTADVGPGEVVAHRISMNINIFSFSDLSQQVGKILLKKHVFLEPPG